MLSEDHDIVCEQALCLGKKIARKGKGRGERAFSLFPLPNSPLDQRPVHRLITTQHVSYSPVAFVTHKHFAVLFFLPSCCVNSLLALKNSQRNVEHTLQQTA